MEHSIWQRIQRLENCAKEQDKFAKEMQEKGEPSFNLHSALAEKFRQQAQELKEKHAS